jgi:hypothetical protein
MWEFKPSGDLRGSGGYVAIRKYLQILAVNQEETEGE